MGPMSRPVIDGIASNPLQRPQFSVRLSRASSTLSQGLCRALFIVHAHSGFGHGHTLGCLWSMEDGARDGDKVVAQTRSPESSRKQVYCYS